MPAPIRLAFRSPDFDDPHPAIDADIAQLRSFLAQQGYAASDHDIYLAYGEWSEETNAAGWSSLGNLQDWTENGRDKLLTGLLERLKPAES